MANKTSLSFNEQVWNLITKIPKGKVSTYKDVAHALGTKAYQAVGNALNKNLYAPQVPCHRIVNVNGFVGNYNGGKKKKIQMLKQEGVEINKEGFIDLKRYLFELQQVEKFD